MRVLAAALALSLLAGTALAVPPATDQYLVSVARTAGNEGAFFQTDVWINNPNTQAAAVQVYLLVRNQANASPQTRTITVNAGQTLELLDFFNNAAGFDVDTFVGGLRFTSNVPVIVTGRIYDINAPSSSGGTGTVGQFYPGLSAQLAIGSSQSADIIGLAEDATWRSNLSLIETTGANVTLTIERLDPTTGDVIGTTSEALRAREARQISRVVTRFSPTGTNVRLRIRPTAGTGRALITASRLDNRTNDPYTIEMTTPAAAGSSTGVFDGVILSPDGREIEGGIRLSVSAAGVTAVAGSAGLLCGYQVTFDAQPTSAVPIDAAGQFTLSIPNVQYRATEGGDPIFTITWTITGHRSSNGVFTGDVGTATTGGLGADASCNGSSSRDFRAGWAGNS